MKGYQQNNRHITSEGVIEPDYQERGARDYMKGCLPDNEHFAGVGDLLNPENPEV